MKKYLDFTVDYDGEIEEIDEFTVDGKIVNIEEYSVSEILEKLKEIDGFFLSEHRTQIFIWWNENDTMDITFRVYTEPDWNKFIDKKLVGLKPI